MKVLTIFIELLDEGTTCWRPVQAEVLADGSFLILDPTPEGELWRFNRGDIVLCKPHQFQDSSGLVAYMRKQ